MRILFVDDPGMNIFKIQITFLKLLIRLLKACWNVLQFFFHSKKNWEIFFNFVWTWINFFLFVSNGYSCLKNLPVSKVQHWIQPYAIFHTRPIFSKLSSWQDKNAPCAFLNKTSISRKLRLYVSVNFRLNRSKYSAYKRKIEKVDCN